MTLQKPHVFEKSVSLVKLLSTSFASHPVVPLRKVVSETGILDWVWPDVLLVKSDNSIL